MSAPAIPRRYILAGQTVARRVPEVLARRGLTPAFDRWVLTDPRRYISGEYAHLIQH